MIYINIESYPYDVLLYAFSEIDRFRGFASNRILRSIVSLFDVIKLRSCNLLHYVGVWIVSKSVQVVLCDIAGKKHNSFQKSLTIAYTEWCIIWLTIEAGTLRWASIINNFDHIANRSIACVRCQWLICYSNDHQTIAPCSLRSCTDNWSTLIVQLHIIDFE